MESTSTSVDKEETELCCIDDILEDILFRLPLKSIYRLKCVSKKWQHLISNPCFASTYASLRGRRALLLGFFQTPTMSLSFVTSGRPTCTFLPTLPREEEEEAADIIKSLESSQETLNRIGYFICSSNGLFLMCSHSPIMTYHIYNPLTRESYQLPPPQQQSWMQPIMALAVAADNDACCTYKVVRMGMGRSTNRSIEIEIFSSKTGEWQQSTVALTDEMYNHFLRPMNMKATVIRGAIHWMSCDYYNNLLVYDPYKRDDHIEIIKTPDTRGVNVILGESTDGLLQMALLDLHKSLIQVWVYHSNGEHYEEYHRMHYKYPGIVWLCRHELRFSPKELPLSPYPCFNPQSNIQWLNLLAFHPHNLDAVFINFNGHIFLCYLNTKRIEAVRCRDRTAGYSIGLQPYFLPLWPLSPLPLLERQTDQP